MPEQFLHYIWKHRLFNEKTMYTPEGERVEVIKTGEQNPDAGPDFTNAQIKIGNTLWAGNVEIHDSSSDWKRHHHHEDRSYDNVILQVVKNNDIPVFRTNGQKIPTVEITFRKKYYDNYKRLLKSTNWIPCQKDLESVERFRIHYWINSILFERLEKKSERIKNTLLKNNNDWEETFYIHLAGNFGFKLNAMPFELLARSLPFKYLARHKDNLTQLEALLFGQAGFLENPHKHPYISGLKKEYAFLQQKYRLTPLEKHLWKFLRSRPANFPTLRIAQFAALVYNSANLFSKVIDCHTVEQLRQLFSHPASSFWDNHYTFEKESAKRKKMPGYPTIHLIIINTLVPFLFLYGKARNKQHLPDRAIEWLHNLPPEKNAVINKWNQLGLQAGNAADTQGLLHLKKEYCSYKKCLSCQIGNIIINQ